MGFTEEGRQNSRRRGEEEQGATSGHRGHAAGPQALRDGGPWTTSVESPPSGQGIGDLQGKPCVFCDILRGRAPAAVVYDDGRILAIMDIRPINTGHVLVMPHRHYPHILEMSTEAVAALYRAVHRIAAAVHDALGADGLNIGQNNGASAAQIIPHVHVHIVPRFYGDSTDGRWPRRKEASMEELQAVAVKIRARLPPPP